MKIPDIKDNIIATTQNFTAKSVANNYKFSIQFESKLKQFII